MTEDLKMEYTESTEEERAMMEKLEAQGMQRIKIHFPNESDVGTDGGSMSFWVDKFSETKNHNYEIIAIGTERDNDIPEGDFILMFHLTQKDYKQ